jgi:hypothetical protein
MAFAELPGFCHFCGEVSITSREIRRSGAKVAIRAGMDSTAPLFATGAGKTRGVANVLRGVRFLSGVVRRSRTREESVERRKEKKRKPPRDH